MTKNRLVLIMSFFSLSVFAEIDLRGEFGCGPDYGEDHESFYFEAFSGNGHREIRVDGQVTPMNCEISSYNLKCRWDRNKRLNIDISRGVRELYNQDDEIKGYMFFGEMDLGPFSRKKGITCHYWVSRNR